MTRSAFLKSLAAVLAGTHAAGPAWPGTAVTDAVRRCVARVCSPEPARACPPQAASCR